MLTYRVVLSFLFSLSLSLFFDQANRRTTEDVIAQLNEKSVRLLPRGK